MTMKKLIKWTLNHVPRPLLQRIAGWAVPMAGLFYLSLIHISEPTRH